MDYRVNCGAFAGQLFGRAKRIEDRDLREAVFLIGGRLTTNVVTVDRITTEVGRCPFESTERQERAASVLTAALRAAALDAA